jgi:hypothetical protein
MFYPGRAAFLALLWYGAVVWFGGYLGVLSSFDAHGTTVKFGFWHTHWGPLFLVLMPMGAFATGALLRNLANGTRGIDLLIRPITAGERPFSDFLAEKLDYAIRNVIRPTAVFLPLILTVIADGADIIAPLQSNVVAPSPAIDWSTQGFKTGAANAHWYLVFNLAAWVMQLFVSYAAWFIFLVHFYALGLIFHYGLGGRRLLNMFQLPGRPGWPSTYKVKWQFTDCRCGLQNLDLVFLYFVIANLLVIVACAISIYFNVYVKGGATIGSWILLIFSIALPIASGFWVFIPYFSNFPSSLPDDLSGKAGVVEPSPWPFGSEKLTWFIIGLVSFVWMTEMTWVMFGKHDKS